MASKILKSIKCLVVQATKNSNFTCMSRTRMRWLLSCLLWSLMVQTASSLPDTLRLHIDEEGMAKLSTLRSEALAEGLLVNRGDWVKAVVGDSIQAEVRLKGDWPTHLEGEKWSLRIKTNKQYRWHGLRSFSVHRPEARHFLSEWVYHRWLQKEGVLTTRYEFITLILNGRNLGVYALEEHFDRELLLAQGREEAPILKFDESSFWEVQHYQLKNDTNINKVVADYEAATITPFKKNRTLKDEWLKQQFEKGKALMHQYQYSLTDAANLFDVELLAKYYAMADIAQAYHALVWHNQRFYYNVSSKKLEPIAYDCYTEEGVYKWFSKPYLGYWNDTQYDSLYFRNEYVVFHPLNDSAVFQCYHHYLKKYSNTAYLQALMKELMPAIKEYTALMQKEYPNYQYTNQYAARAKELEETVAQQHPKGLVHQTFGFKPFWYYKGCALQEPLKHLAVKAYVESTSDSTMQLALHNFHCEAVIIYGGVEGRDELSEALAILPAYNNDKLTSKHLLTVKKGQHLWFTLNDHVPYRSDVLLIPWKSPY